VTVTPLDLATSQFKTSVRGFDRREVTEFLAGLADDYEKALREADRLRDDLGRALAVVQEHKEQERSLQATLMTAQKLADEIRHTAEQESERIIAEGQMRAAAVLAGTAPRADAIDGEIAALRARRNQAASDLDATIATLRATLQAVRMQTQS
jgi:cell division initiation protein